MKSFLKPTLSKNAVSLNKQPVEPIDTVRSEEECPLITSHHNSFNAEGMNSRINMQRERQRLPIYQYQREILYLLEVNQVLILVGQTGCGKSTQIPQFFYEAYGSPSNTSGNGFRFACTQPRKVAATSVATRVAQEMNCQLGQQVGYVVRFEKANQGDVTKILYLTDGALFREALSDPLLSRYSHIMIDEAHERTVHTDLICGLLLKIMKKRRDLKVIVSSATLDAALFRDFFKDFKVGVLAVPGRTFPIQIFYSLQSYNLMDDLIQGCVDTVLKIHHLEEEGDILVFLSGREDIQKAMELLNISDDLVNAKENRLYSVALYAGLALSSQLRAFEPCPEKFRKVIFSTNIAEASVTIDGIVYVVDSGRVKLRASLFESGVNGLESLLLADISRASAMQRAGRAGRTKPGKVFRMYTQRDYESFLPTTLPDLQRSNLTTVILQLKALGIDNIAKFKFISQPPPGLVMNALETLYSLGAINEFGKLTDPLGLQMAELPIDPMLSKVLLGSTDFYCAQEALTIAAMISTSSDNIWTASNQSKDSFQEAQHKFAVEEGDHLTLLNIYRAFEQKLKKLKDEDQVKNWCKTHYLNYKVLVEARRIRHQLGRYLIDRFGKREIESPDQTCRIDTIMVRKCLLSGFFYQVAEFQPSLGYYTSCFTPSSPSPSSLHNNNNNSNDHDNTIPLYIHPDSVLFKGRAPAFVMYDGNLVETSRVFMKRVTVVQPDWLAELMPHVFEFSHSKLPSHQ